MIPLCSMGWTTGPSLPEFPRLRWDREVTSELSPRLNAVRTNTALIIFRNQSNCASRVPTFAESTSAIQVDRFKVAFPRYAANMEFGEAVETRNSMLRQALESPHLDANEVSPRNIFVGETVPTLNILGVNRPDQIAWTSEVCQRNEGVPDDPVPTRS